MSDERTPIRDAIQQAIDEHPVILFMKGTPEQPACGFSARTVAALEALGAPFAAVDILPDPRIRQELSAISNWPTIPQLFVNGELVGGCDIVTEMYESGELAQALGVEHPRTARRRGARRPDGRRPRRCRSRTGSSAAQHPDGHGGRPADPLVAVAVRGDSVAPLVKRAVIPSKRWIDAMSLASSPTECGPGMGSPPPPPASIVTVDSSAPSRSESSPLSSSEPRSRTRLTPRSDLGTRTRTRTVRRVPSRRATRRLTGRREPARTRLGALARRIVDWCMPRLTVRSAEMPSTWSGPTS